MGHKILLFLNMRLAVFVLLLVHCGCDIQVSVDRIKGQYSVSIDNHVWLQSSRIALYVDDRWYSSNDSSLPLIDIRLVQGNDPNLGSWNETQLIYTLNHSGTVSNITGRIRQWNSYPAISFHLDTGDKMLINNNLLDKNQVRTIFPSFNIEQIGMNDNRAYFTYQGKKRFF
jgi:LEA14-like dessication related protein